MTRKLCFLASCLLLGIYLAYFGMTANVLTILLVVIFVAIFKLIISKKLKNLCYVFAALVFVGGAVSLIYNNDITLKGVYPYLDEYINIKAEVLERPKFEDGKMKFNAKIRELSFLDENIILDEKVRLTYRTEQNTIDFGDIITARVRINLPSSAENDGAFDYALYLKTDKIFFSGYVDGESLTACGRKEFGISDYIKQFNYNCCDLIDETLPENIAPILKAVLLGDKSDFSDSDRQMLSRSGLAHATAVSGLHVSTVAALIFALFKLLKIRNKIAGVFAIIFVGLFVVISGATVSAVRAGIMTVMAIIAEFIYRKSDAYTSMATASIAIVSLSPFAAFDAGFLLSFGAVFGILLFDKRIEKYLLPAAYKGENRIIGLINKALRKVLAIFCTSLAVQLTTAPLMLYLYQEFTFWSFVSNIIIIPVLSFIMLSGLLICTIGFIAKPITLCAAGLGYPFLILLKKTIKFFGSLDFGYITYGHITAFFIFTYILCLSGLYLLLDKKRRSVSLILLISVFILFIISGINYLTDTTARVRFLNVGQGDSSCISLPRGTDVLIDGGGTPAHMEFYDVGLKTVKPYLLKQGVNSIEYMIASHGHDDHIMGLCTLIENIKTDCLLVPVGFGKTETAELLLTKAKELNIPVHFLKSGDLIKLAPNAELEVISPAVGNNEDENENSLVVRIKYGKNSILYTGDLSDRAELEIINKDIDADILKVAHHGSSKSTTNEFLEQVTPQYAFIPVGENSYGHPGSDVIKRLQGNLCTVFRADKDNDVIFTMDLNRITSVSD